MLTPQNYADRYSRLNVYTYTDAQASAAIMPDPPPDAKLTPVCVCKYRLGLHGTQYRHKANSLSVFQSAVMSHLGKKNDPITVWVIRSTDGKVEARTYRTRAEVGSNFIDPFYGKGSPEEVQVVLQLAVRFGALTPEQLQPYCDNGNIGLDCNGFVGNYIHHIRRGFEWWDTSSKGGEINASSYIQTFASSKALGSVSALDELARDSSAIYILMMCTEDGTLRDHQKVVDPKTGNVTTKYGHIMISQPGTLRKSGNPYAKDAQMYSLTVLESGGGIGLCKSTYWINQPHSKSPVFVVNRGSVNGAKLFVLVSKLR